jgi:group II intron reverse transcriptase/maturase
MIALTAEHIPSTYIELPPRKLEVRARALWDRLYTSAKATPDRSYGILYDKVHRWDILLAAWRRVAANRGKPGHDRQSIDWVKNEYGIGRFLDELQEELRSGTYQPQPVLRVYIPKEPGKERPLGIPVLRDRVAQMAVKLVIEPLFEADFCDCSFGFRPGRSNKDAAQLVHRKVNYRKHVVDVDMKGYFDTIPHEPLLALVRRRVRDRRVMHLLRG